MAGNTNSADIGLSALVGLRRALLRASLVFGTLAVAVIAVLGGASGDRSIRSAGFDAGVDDMMTGSIAGGERYVVSRSVLQPPGSAPCLLFPDGSRRGAC